MLQVFPIHVSIFNYAGLTYDRYQGIRYPDKRNVPVMVFTISSWILALCSVLPYTGFITYIDLEQLRGPQYQNLGLCFIHVQKTIEDYLRATFFCIFIIPLLVIVYLLTRTSWELGFQQKTAETCVCDAECGILLHLPSQTLLRLKHAPDASRGMVLDGHHPENSLAYSRSAEPTHTRGNRLDSETFDAQSVNTQFVTLLPSVVYFFWRLSLHLRQLENTVVYFMVPRWCLGSMAPCIAQPRKRSMDPELQ
ncbi:hypothetical protein RvY_16881-1 [Ramazzottius varieornatus]|uniref:G-protein coupled receptors family 1 profile domain-containing protein n=1 Tax=Ramazzottius varieornatus TaxID=947166 RepID=A0A1D1W4A2_RAMVA|nr:hypothetical protein RvY_16881-1 [Ramazzottius varieornatus]